MLTLKSKCLALLGGALLAASPVLGQDSGALIDLLVKKGIVTDQEAENLRAELTRDFAANTSAGKLNISSSVSEFKLSGDLRLRHQIETQAPSVASGTAPVTNERTRERFRFRFNGDVLLQKGWGVGFALETAQTADSGNQTFQGNNDDYGIFLGRAYISYQPNINWMFVAGKQRIPFYATDLRWDTDINPQGTTEMYKAYIGAKDTFEIRAMQDIMEDRNERIPGPLGRDAWLFEQQAVYTHWFGRDEIGNVLSSVVLAPGFYKYNASGIDLATNENPFNGSVRYQTAATFAGEVNFANVAGEGTAFKVYWDSVYNFEAASRVSKVYGLSLSRWSKDPWAWAVGVGYANGAGKTQGDYSLKLDYRHVGLGSSDVNTNDSDWAFGKLSQKGWKFAGSYNLTDFTSFNATYCFTTPLQNNLTYTLANVDHTQLLMLDLIVKF